MTIAKTAGVEGGDPAEPVIPPVAGEPGGEPPVNTPAEPPVEPVTPDADPGIEPDPVTLTQEEYDRLNKRILDKDTFIRTQQSELDKFKNAPVEPTPPMEPAVNTSLDGKPTLEQYDFDEAKYSEALMDWKLDQRDAAKSINALAESEERTRQERLKNFGQRASVFRAKQADYDDIANAPEIARVYGQAPHLADIVESSEAGPEIAYYFGNNPDIAANIANMSPYNAAIEIGKLEAKVLVAPKPKNITQAPTPIQPVGGGHDPAEKSVEDMSQEEYEAARGSGKL